MSRFAPVLALLASCVQPLEPPPPIDDSAMAPGETRSVELRMLRLDVEGYEQTVDLQGLRDLPAGAIDDVFLLDLELTPLVRNTLAQLRDLPFDEAQQLPVAAQNMRTLLRTTPDNVDLDGTALEELISVSAALGIPPASALSEVLEVGVTEPILDLDIATDAVVNGLIATHPSANGTRLPVTLGDVLREFDDLTERFGPAPNGHPGFIRQAEGLTVTEADFAMTVKVDANALPFKGIDAGSATVASVNSIPSQIDTLFPTDDPEWLRIDGLVPQPSIATMTVFIGESDGFHPAGDSRQPVPTGNSTAWDLDPWVFENIVAELTFDLAQQVSPHTVTYALGTGTTAFEAVIDEGGWVTFQTFDGVGNPPAPRYLWDLKIELAQQRIHDGGLAEGEADVEFTLRDVELGIPAEAIVTEIRDNLAADPTALRGLAAALVDTGRGAADVFYVRPPPDAPEPADWLFFIAPEDIPEGDDGPVRPYDYERVGFFSDAALTDKVSDTREVDGDTTHEKVRVAPGDVLYIQDDAGAVFRLDVRDKPSAQRLAVDVTRER
jgi:hypothetical protein